MAQLICVFLHFSSLASTACNEQSKKIEVASYLKLKIQSHNADTLRLVAQQCSTAAFVKTITFEISLHASVSVSGSP